MILRKCRRLRILRPTRGRATEFAVSQISTPCEFRRGLSRLGISPQILRAVTNETGERGVVSASGRRSEPFGHPTAAME